MEPQNIRIGQIIDLKINRAEQPTYIVGPVQGIRQDYFNVDQVAVLISGVDLWLVLDDTVEVSEIE